LAVRALLVNFSCPLGSAESLIVLPEPPLPDDEEDDEGALVVVVVLLPPLDPPHAAIPSVSVTATRHRAEILGTCVPLVRSPDPG
jgi:hypothetical protein